MKKEDVVALGVEAEAAEKVLVAFQEELKGYVKKAEYDLKAQELEAANSSIKEMKQKMKDFDGVDVAALQGAVKEWEKKYNDDIAGLKQEYALKERDRAVDLAIVQAKGRNPKAIKALLDLDKVTLNEDGTLAGLDLEGIKKSDSYLFESIERVTEGTGFTKGNGNRSIDTSNMTYSQMLQNIETNTMI